MGAFTIPSIFTAVDKFSAPLRKMTRSAQSFGSKASAGVDRLDRRLRRLTPSLGGVQRQLLAFASAGVLIAGIGSAVNTVKDFEQANANLASVMGTTIQANQLLAKDAERLGSITAKSATEVVGLQEAYARLGFSQTEIVDVTEATINGSIAMNAELAQTAELTGAMIRTFKDFSSADAPQILDQMTLATQKSALNFEKLNTALPVVSGAANQAGIPFNKMLALLGKLSDAGIDASSSSTALRNIFLDSAKKGKSYDQILEEIVKQKDKLTASFDEFGKRGAVSASILAENIAGTEELAGTLALAAKGQELEGVASRTAATQLDTLQGSLTLLSSAYEGLLIRLNNGSGALGIFRKLVDFTARNIETIATVILTLVGTFIALKTIIWATRTTMLAYNIVMGISAVIQGKAAWALRGNTAAMLAYNIASKAVAFFTGVWSAAQKILNIILIANPIGLIIMLIGLLVAAIIWVVSVTEGWGEQWDEIMGYMTAELLMFKHAAIAIWLAQEDAFLTMVEGLVLAWKWGQNLMGNLSDEQFAKDKARIEADKQLRKKAIVDNALELFKAKARVDKGIALKLRFKDDEADGADGVDGAAGETAKLINNDKNKQEGIVDKIEETKKQEVTITVNDPNGTVNVEGGGGGVPVNVGSTSGF